MKFLWLRETIDEDFDSDKSKSLTFDFDITGAKLSFYSRFLKKVFIVS